MQYETFYYTRVILETIAEDYRRLYEGLSFRDDLIINPWSLAEYKADFDMALRGIGKGKWNGNLLDEFKYYRNYSKRQRVIIAAMFGIQDTELTRLHFRDIPRLRNYAYFLMKMYLNGGNNV